MLDVALDTPLPSRLEVGRGTALFLRGRCRDTAGPIRDLELTVDGEAQPLMAWGMPRGLLDPRRDAWWGMVRLGAVTETAVAMIGLRSIAGDGTPSKVRLGPLRLDPALEGIAVEPGASGGSRPDRPSIAICMATYEPRLDLFRSQVDSIRGQTHDDWTCVLSDDASRPETVAAMRDVLGGDPRFRVDAHRDRLGPYRNFERALRLAPSGARHIAIADQDDRWYPEKLEVLQRRLHDPVKLVYGDMRVVTQDGEVLSDTFWRYRRNNYTDFGSLIVANSVTGAASLFTRDLLAQVLPFPPLPGEALYDHWIAMVAMAAGELAYVDRPLHDYVQHPGATLGHPGSNAGRGRSPIGAVDRALRVGRLAGRVVRPRARDRYFERYCQTLLAGAVLEAREDEMAPEKRAALERITAVEESPRKARWLTARALRSFFATSDTIGMERGLLVAVAWRWLTGLRGAGRSSARRRRRP